MKPPGMKPVPKNHAAAVAGDPTGYAVHKYNYYLCHKCDKPYFGGARACGGGGGGGAAGAAQ